MSRLTDKPRATKTPRPEPLAIKFREQGTSMTGTFVRWGTSGGTTQVIIAHGKRLHMKPLDDVEVLSWD